MGLKIHCVCPLSIACGLLSMWKRESGCCIAPQKWRYDLIGLPQLIIDGIKKCAVLRGAASRVTLSCKWSTSRAQKHKTVCSSMIKCVYAWKQSSVYSLYCVHVLVYNLSLHMCKNDDFLSFLCAWMAADKRCTKGCFVLYIPNHIWITVDFIEDWTIQSNSSQCYKLKFSLLTFQSALFISLCHREEKMLNALLTGDGAETCSMSAVSPWDGRSSRRKCCIHSQERRWRKWCICPRPSDDTWQLEKPGSFPVQYS